MTNISALFILCFLFSSAYSHTLWDSHDLVEYARVTARYSSVVNPDAIISPVTEDFIANTEAIKSGQVYFAVINSVGNFYEKISTREADLERFSTDTASGCGQHVYGGPPVNYLPDSGKLCTRDPPFIHIKYLLVYIMHYLLHDISSNTYII